MKVEEQANFKDTSVSVQSASTTSQDENDYEDRFDQERDTNRERNRFHRNPHNILNNFPEWALFMDRPLTNNTLDSSNSSVTAATTYLEEKARFWYYSKSSNNRGVSTASPQQQQYSSPNQRESRAGSTLNASPPHSSSPLITAPKISLLCHPHLIQEHIKRNPSAINQMDRDMANADNTNNVLTDILDDLPTDNNINNNILEAGRSTDQMQNIFPRVVSLSADFFNRSDEVAVSCWIAQQRQMPTSPTAATGGIAGPQSSPISDDSVNLQQQQEVTYSNSGTLLNFNPHAPRDASPRIQRSRSTTSNAATASSTTTTVPFHNIRIVPYSSNRGLPKKMQLVFDKYWQRIVQAVTDGAEFSSILYEFWDEIFPHSKSIAYHDGHTPVPRLDTLETFLTAPCPRHIGIVQCEIERVKVVGKKNVKGRFFPTYEYNLFIRDNGRIHTSTIVEQSAQQLQQSSTDSGMQHVLLMRAKNYGRSCYYNNADYYSRVIEETPTTCTSSTSAEALQRRTQRSRPIKLKKKRGVNNYFLCMEPLTNSATISRSTSLDKSPEPKLIELGRLQSNLLGTEFQIFSPRKSKAQFCNNRERFDSSCNTLTPTEHGQTILSPSEANTSRNVRGRSSSTSDRSTRLGYSWPLLKKSSRHNRRAIAQDELPSSYQHCPETVGNPNESLPHLGREIESGIITYTANLLGNRPRVMDVCIPKPQSMVEEECCDDGSDYLLRCQWETHCQRTINEGQCESIEGENLMLTRFRQLQERLDLRVDDDENLQGVTEEPAVDEGGDDFGLLVLQNRPPWWNEDLGAFVLNFGGRVSVASVKNFQLCHRNDHDYVMLQFGRIQGRHSFTMDFQYPLTAVQAFAIAISSLQSKISLG
jgi:hypothetical protein